ncbi:MAG TPA: cation:proton antiporter [Planctomycetota bacterium]|nr:cation:proton antiporter [Planctomycetota bacterium]
MHGLLHDIGISVIAATVLGLLALFLRQPIILGYLIAGALVGPELGFGLVKEAESIEIISEIGLILLLFVIGLEMRIGDLLSSGRQLLVVGLGQFPLCAALGVGLFMLTRYGFSGQKHMNGLYLALICNLSSTAIVVKLLYDKFELDTLAGRLTIGVLVIQDVYAILVLAFQPNLADPQALPIIKALGASAVLLVAGFLLSSLVLRYVFAAIAKSPELVVATFIGWCAFVAGAAAAMGLSQEMGALVAGLTISAFPYSLHVTAKTLPLRDFFLTLFFLSLGMKITAPSWGLVGPVALVTAFVIGSRFLSVYPLLALSGAGRRTCFLTSLNLAQLSEFALVIATLGVGFGHVKQDIIGVLVYAMAITAVLSSYSIRWSHGLHRLFERVLSGVGLGTRRIEAADTAAGYHPPVVLLGFHRGARALVDLIEERQPALLSKLLVVDYNPEVLAELKRRGVAGAFGDLGSADTLAHVHLEYAQLIISTIPDMLLKSTDNESLVKTCRALAPEAHIVAVADHGDHEQRLHTAGATSTLLPYGLMAERLVELVGSQVADEVAAG